MYKREKWTLENEILQQELLLEVTIDIMSLLCQYYILCTPFCKAGLGAVLCVILPPKTFGTTRTFESESRSTLLEEREPQMASVNDCITLMLTIDLQLKLYSSKQQEVLANLEVLRRTTSMKPTFLFAHLNNYSTYLCSYLSRSWLRTLFARPFFQ